MKHLKRTAGAFLFLGALFLAMNLGGTGGCGSGGSAGGNLVCTGASCACPSGKTCDITQSDCGSSSCSLDCNDNNDCSGSCGASCSADCGGGSVCDLTVGESGSVTCTTNSECHVTCTGNCSLSCSNGATCDLKCAGDASPHAVAESDHCAL